MKRCQARLALFKTYHKLQGSQTEVTNLQNKLEFKTYHKLQGSQTTVLPKNLYVCLRHIINYKVLKQITGSLFDTNRLRHIINYKVLKLDLART